MLITHMCVISKVLIVVGYLKNNTNFRCYLYSYCSISHIFVLIWLINCFLSVCRNVATLVANTMNIEFESKNRSTICFEVLCLCCVELFLSYTLSVDTSTWLYFFLFQCPDAC